MKNVATMRTDRLILRRWRESDRDAFHALNTDPQVMATVGPVMNRVESDGFMDRIEHGFDDHGFGLWCVEIDGEAIGFTGFMAPRFRTGVEIGWRIHADHWGCGYATEAALRCLAHGFDDLDFREVISFTAAINVRSRRVMEKLGFVYDDTEDFHHPSIPEGSPLQEHVLYRMTLSQYRGQS